jgi:hypothetical protein
LTAYKVKRQRWHAIEMSFRKAIFDRYVLSFDETRISQTFAKCDSELFGCVVLIGAEKSDHRHRRLLRPRRERPRSRHSTEKGDELAPLHVPPLEHALCNP